MALNVEKIREMFPILDREVAGRHLIYLDNAATSQTPAVVVDQIKWAYEHTKANVHRGVHTLSQEATDLQEMTRKKTAGYIGASSEKEIIFTRGTTESINLVASSYGELIPEGSEIILTVMEHHANIVPWQLLQTRKKLKFRVVDIKEDGSLDLDQYESFFNEKTALASFCHVSNVLGVVNPVKEMTAIAHSHGVPVVIDGAQAAPHTNFNVAEIGCDFYAFSSHKMYGPTGIGVLYGKKEMLEKMPPYQGGGEMISTVSFEGTTFAELPYKFEAGTPDFIGIAAFSKALEFINQTGMPAMEEHSRRLTEIAMEEMRKIKGVRIFGTTPDKAPVISFIVDGIHPYDIGMLLDKLGVAVRTGHHCAQPLMDRLGVPGTVRASFAVYNTEKEVDAFIEALKRVISMFRTG